MSGIRLYKYIYFFLFLFGDLLIAQQKPDNPIELFTQDSVKIFRLQFDTIRNYRNLPFEIYKLKQPKVALVLSGGGARGIAHIGVLQVLEKYNIPINIIYGTSIGAIVGGLYSIGYSINGIINTLNTLDMNDIFSLTKEIKRRDVYPEQKQNLGKSFLTLRFNGLEPVIPASFSSGQKVTNLINLLVLQAPYHNHKTFDDFPIRFRAIATDLVKGESIVLKDGDLSEAIRASFTWPLLNPMVERDSMKLCDGGILSNLPAHFAKDDKNDILIAVNATTPKKIDGQLLSAVDIFNQVLSVMQDEFTEKELQLADILIQPELNQFPNTSFENINGLIKTGNKEAERHIEKIVQMLNSYRKKYSDSMFNIGKVEFIGGEYNYDFEEEIRNDLLSRKVSSFDINHTSEKLVESGNFQDVNCQIRKNEKKYDLKFIFKEYPKIDSIIFENNILFHTDSLKKLFSPLIGSHFNTKVWNNCVDSLLKIFRMFSFSLANIKYVSFDTARHILKINLEEGKIKRIDVIGNKNTNKEYVLAEFPLTVGDYFHHEKAERGLISISSTNLFEQVILDVGYEDEKPILRIKVDEKPTSLIRFGFRVDNERNSQASIDIRDENITGSADNFGLSFQGGARNFLSLIDFKSNRLFQTKIAYKFKLKYQYEQLFTYEDEPTTSKNIWKRRKAGEFSEDRFGASVSIGGLMQKFGFVYGEAKFEKVKISPESGAGYSTDNLFISALRGGIVIDNQDDFTFPQNGMLLNAYYETNFTKLGSDISYIKYFLDYGFYITFNTIHTIHPRFIFGYGDNTLPYCEQYRFGGQNSFFGFRENEFRGRQLLISSLEYRLKLPFKLFFPSYLNFRFDTGSIWENARDIKIPDLRYGIGSSLSLDTPVGLAQFSVGNSFLFTRDLPNNPVSFGPLYFYFSIGYDFDM